MICQTPDHCGKVCHCGASMDKHAENHPAVAMECAACIDPVFRYFVTGGGDLEFGQQQIIEVCESAELAWWRVDRDDPDGSFYQVHKMSPRGEAVRVHR